MFTMHILSLCGLLTTVQFKFASLDTDNGFHCSTEDLEKMLKTHKIIPDLLTVVPEQCLYNCSATTADGVKIALFCDDSRHVHTSTHDVEVLFQIWRDAKLHRENTESGGMAAILKICCDVKNYTDWRAVKKKVEMNGKILKPGSGVDHLDTLEEPNKIKWNYENGTLYSFVMTGLDVPTQEDPHDRESQHWIVGNIPGNNITAGDKLFSFEPAGIEYGEGIHRVVFLVFKQSMPIEFTHWHPQIREDSIYRAHFSTKQFSEKYKLGLPIAVNFYEFDIDQ